MSDVVIKVENLTKSYPLYDEPLDRMKEALHPFRRKYHRDFYALKDVSFEIRRGETVGIIGRNGAGKSTLLKILTGVLTPTSGHVSVQGRVLALLELGAGFNPELTGIENVYFNGALFGATREEIDQKMEAILEFADIGEFVHQPVKTYSSGMTVRLAFAVIANMEPEVLIVDEALAVGDAFFVQKCMRFLRRFIERGTLVFVSHDSASIRSLCSRALWFDKGIIAEDGEPKKISDSYLKHLYSAQQGESTTTVDSQISEVADDKNHSPFRRDMRQDFLNSSNLRNDIQIMELVPQLNSFGKGGVSLKHVTILDEEGTPLSWIVGGEVVKISIDGRAHQYLKQIVVGFVIKDRLGQYLFGDNTYLSFVENPIAVSEGNCFHACFRFVMPILRTGDYSIDVAVADGTQTEHVQQIWVNDVLSLKSVTSAVCNGLVGIPMEQIELTVK